MTHFYKHLAVHALFLRLLPLAMSRPPSSQGNEKCNLYSSYILIPLLRYASQIYARVDRLSAQRREVYARGSLKAIYLDVSGLIYGRRTSV